MKRFVKSAATVTLVCLISAATLAASPLLKAGVNYAGKRDFKNALYVLGRSQKEEADALVEATLWRLAISTAQSRARTTLWVALGASAEPASDLTRAISAAMLDSIREEAFTADGVVLRDMDLLSATTTAPRYMTLSLPSDYALDESTLADDFDAKCKLGIYPGDAATRDRLKQLEWLAFGAALVKWSGMSHRDAAIAFVKGIRTFDVDLARALLDQIDFYEGYVEDILARGMVKVMELTKDDPYCEPRLEVERRLAELTE